MANTYRLVKIEWYDEGYNQGSSFFAAVPAKASSQEISAWAFKCLVRDKYDEENIKIENILAICDDMELAALFVPDAFRYLASGQIYIYRHTFSGNIRNLCRKNSPYNYDRPPSNFLVMGNNNDFDDLRIRWKKYSKQYRLIDV